jgi:flavin reductase (DIM6/NTAB) family NADH-FMN oxidoreductase RutF
MSSEPRESDVPLATDAMLSQDTPLDAMPPRTTLDLGELEGDPAVAFRRTLGMFATGVTVLTTSVDGQVPGMTVNAFMSVSLAPPLVLVSIDHRARMLDVLREGVPLGVSVLAESQRREADYFARRPVEGFEPTFVMVDDTPLVEGALAQLAGRIVRSYWGGDHSLFLVQVTYARYGEGTPLLFHGGRYQRLVTEAKVLAALPPELLEPLLASGEERRFAPGTTIMRRGEPGDDLLLVLEGSVLVARPGKQVVLGPGEIVGELEVLSQSVGGRFADIEAVDEVRGLVVSRDQLRAALVAHPDAALALLEVLADRFRETA